ncbi:MAG: hypothetical protein K6G90_09315 [Clostridia bacterium]|nr:hypothetical protein [Clostridia bacterium]
MASYCPNCNYKLSLIDTKPECPVCGVNLMYFGMEERLKEEADKAEFEHANTQPHIDRLKHASIGNPFAIARLVLAVLTLAAGIAPFARTVTTLPFRTVDKTIGLINVVTDVYMKLDFDYYFKMFKEPLFGRGYLFEFIALVLFTLCLVAALVNLVNILFAGGKRAIRRHIVVASCGIVFAVGAVIAFALSISAFNRAIPEIYAGQLLPWGIITVIGAFILQIAMNLIYKKYAPPVKYKDVSKFLVRFDEREPENQDAQPEEPAKETE